MGVQTAEDRKLVRDVLNGHGGARERLLKRVSGTAWNACRLLTRDEADAREALLHVMAEIQADGFRRLRPYDGSSRLETFVALIARDLVASRLLHLFTTGGDEGWAAFELFFKTDLDSMIARRLPGADRDDARRDARQEISLALVADGGRRLKAYTGVGSFTGFVLRTVDRLLIDHIRRSNPRQRMPAAIARMGDLEQAVFRADRRLGSAAGGGELAAAVARDIDPPPTAAELDRALERVRRASPDGGGAVGVAVPLPDDLVSDSPNPEEELIAAESQRTLNSAVAALHGAVATLAADERLYLRIALSGCDPLPARDVAKVMQRPVEEIYQLKRQVFARLRRMIEHDAGVKNWMASV